MIRPTSPPRPEPSWLEISLTRLDANVAHFRSLLGQDRASGGARLCAVVKADAYCLGAQAIAQRLARAGVEMLAVYSLSQARELVEAGITRPILVMMPLREIDRGDVLYRTLLAGRLHLMVHDRDQLRQVADIGTRFGCAIPVHLFLDTGLCREGMSDSDFHDALAACASMRTIRLAGVCSHLADARGDVAFCDEQLERLTAALTSLPQAAGPLVHLANTYATLRHRRYHLSMARIGLGLLGYGEAALGNDRIDAGRTALLPVVRWVSGLVHVTRHRKGETVGYGRTHTLTRDSVLGVVPVGYADGYPQALGNRASVRLIGDTGQVIGQAPVVGKVNMDQTVIDLTDAPRPEMVHQVELLSAEHDSPCSLDRLAEHAGANCYEMLTRLSARLPRRYLQADREAGDKEPARWGRTVQRVRTLALVG